MTHAPAEVAIEYEIADAQERKRFASPKLRGFMLLAPAVVVAILFSIIPLAYLFQVSLTQDSSFFFTAEYTADNYREVFTRYRSAIVETVYLASVSSVLDLVFGYPFAYILIRKIRYREFVRTMMTFPLFGPLYLAFGLFYILLPNGPLGPLFEMLGINIARYLFSTGAVLFSMAVFTFPFMVMNIGAALSNVDPMLEEAARTLGAKPWQTFTRVLFPLSWSGIVAGFLMCFGWNLGVFAQPQLLGSPKEQAVLSIQMFTKGLVQFNYGLAAALGILLMAMAFAVTWASLRFSRGALGA
ncbi:MAG: ABC transporter permease [Chloroflexi bacterium]|nr:ABC transporter permease [Chloroflexota bacterium]